jgi:hypothetical protein
MTSGPIGPLYRTATGQGLVVRRGAMAEALRRLLAVGYDAYIEYERLYVRTPGGGIIAVATAAELEYLLARSASKPWS